jgi:hypothetical protein
VRNFPPHEIDEAAFGRIDFVFSSHEHDDHCHRATLARLRDQIVTVLLPAERPDLEARYRALGFRDVRLLQNATPVTLGEGVEVACFWDEPIDSLLAVRMEGKVVLHMSDSLPTLDLIRRVAAAFPVDYAFVCSTSAQDLYPLLLRREDRELDRLARQREDEFFELQLRRLDVLRPKVVIPYSYTATYVHFEQVRLNGFSRLTPPLFRDRLAERRPKLECWALQPGDVIDVRSSTIRRLRKENLWGESLEEFVANVSAYSRAVAGDLAEFRAGDPAACEERLRSWLRAQLDERVTQPRFHSLLNDAVILHVTGDSRTASYLVDLRDRDVLRWPVARSPGRVPFLEIRIPASLLGSLLAREYDPFMILYTYRVSFEPHAALTERGLSPRQETALYAGTMVALFMKPGDRRDVLLRQVDDYVGPLSWLIRAVSG